MERKCSQFKRDGSRWKVLATIGSFSSSPYMTSGVTPDIKERETWWVGDGLLWLQRTNCCCSLNSILGETLMSCRQSEPSWGETSWVMFPIIWKANLFVGGRSQSYGGLKGGAGDGGVAEPAGFWLGEGGGGGAEGGGARGLDLTRFNWAEDPGQWTKKIILPPHQYLPTKLTPQYLSWGSRGLPTQYLPYNIYYKIFTPQYSPHITCSTKSTPQYLPWGSRGLPPPRPRSAPSCTLSLADALERPPSDFEMYQNVLLVVCCTSTGAFISSSHLTSWMLFSETNQK